MVFVAKMRIEHGTPDGTLLFRPGDVVPDELAVRIGYAVEGTPSDPPPAAPVEPVETETVKTCAYVKRDGTRCTRPAESGSDHCKYCAMQIAKQAKAKLDNEFRRD